MSTTTTAAPAGKTGRPPGPLRRYLTDSRNPLNTALLLLPIFLLYSVGILVTDGVRNGVDLVSDLLRFGVFGGNSLYYFLFNLAIMLSFVITAWVLREKHLFRPRIYLFVILEGAVYGFLLGNLIGRLLVFLGMHPRMAAGAAYGPIDSFVLSLGAGLWEEVVFRLLLLGGSVLLLKRALKLRPALAWTLAILGSSLAFSAIHYVGSLADDFTFYSFFFRFLAGVIFAGIYATRGLAVAVYTHAVYDIMVMVF